MTEEPVGVGLIGCGNIGQIHADGLAKLVEEGAMRAVAAADPSADALAGANRNCPFERTTQEPLEVVNDPEVQAVLVASPTITHLPLVEAVVAAGKSLLCEKPLAPTFDDVRAIVDVVRRGGITAQVGFHQRYHPLYQWLADTVRRGPLGEAMAYALRDDQYWPTGDVVTGHSSWRSERAQAGGGALLEHSIHACDLLSWTFGPVRRVQAAARSVYGYDVEDVAAITVEHENGVVGTLTTVFHGVTGREERRLEVFLERGAVELTSDFIVGAPEDGLLVQRPDRPAERLDVDAIRKKRFAELGITRDDFIFYPYVADRAWLQAITRGDPAWPDVGDALHAHAFVEGAYRSAAEQQPVEVATSVERAR